MEAILREQVEQASQVYYALSDVPLDSPLAFPLRRYAHPKQFQPACCGRFSLPMPLSVTGLPRPRP